MMTSYYILRSSLSEISKYFIDFYENTLLKYRKLNVTRAMSTWPSLAKNVFAHWKNIYVVIYVDIYNVHTLLILNLLA
jgi:hypothetical protein